VSDEETNRRQQEDGLHTRAASIAKHDLHGKTEDLCNQLVMVCDKMVGLFIKAAITCF